MKGRKFLKSRTRRLLSWTGLAVALPALWACTTRSLEMPEQKPAKNNTFTFQESVNRDIDILFMIDNSSSMAKSQANLVRNFPTFMNVLKMLPGGLPNVHIAVVSSDMGAGSVTNGCSGNGMAGIFQNTPKLTVGGNLCNTTLQNNARFIESINGNANFTGDISDVFTCIAALGEDGCGFEQQLLLVTHALGADNFNPDTGKPQPPQENQGFLRDSAYLAIILITNEDDCSAPGGAANGLYPTVTGDNLTSKLGPPTGYRCNRYGHVCNGAPPPKDSPMGAADPGDSTTVVKLQNCTSAENTGPLKDDAQLIPVAAFAEVIKALKPDPTNQILVAAIAGLYDKDDPNGYGVTWKKSVSGDTNGPWPEMVHSCTSAGDMSFRRSRCPRRRVGEAVRAQRRGPVDLRQGVRPGNGAHRR